LANRIIIRSRFREAGAHARKRTHEAVQEALGEGEKAANIRIERINATQAYHLPANVVKEGRGYHSGQIRYPHFFGRFFEYGFYSVPGMPFMRPAARKMNSVFKKEMGNLFKGFRGTR
jgi:hypothetical protein